MIASVAVLVLAVGCASRPGVGVRRCAWPEQIDSARNALLVSRPRDTLKVPSEALLLDVGSGKIVVRCPGIRVENIDSTYFYDAHANPSFNGPEPTVDVDRQFSTSTLPPLSRDRRLALNQPDGVVDLVSGTTYAEPDPGWRAVGFAGDAVLRERRFAPNEHPPVGAGYAPGTFCVAARADTPQGECAPIAGATENGLPLITDSGSVEWAPDSRQVPLALRRSDGATYSGIAQVGPTRIADLHIVTDRDKVENVGFRVYYGAFDRYAPLGRNDTVMAELMTTFGNLEPASPDPRARERISWFTDPVVTPAGVRADLRTATTTWAEAGTAARSLARPPDYALDWASVIDDGAAVLLVFRSPALKDEQVSSYRFVRVPQTGPPTVVALLGTTPHGLLASDTDLYDPPTVLSWP